MYNHIAMFSYKTNFWRILFRQKRNLDMILQI